MGERKRERVREREKGGEKERERKGERRRERGREGEREKGREKEREERGREKERENYLTTLFLCNNFLLVPLLSSLTFAIFHSLTLYSFLSRSSFLSCL